MTKDSYSFFNSDLKEAIQKSDNDISGFIHKIHNTNEDPENGNMHIFIYDDLIPLFLQYPEFFALRTTDTGEMLEDLNVFLLQSAYRDFIENGFILTSRPSVVLSEYPIRDELFRDDVAEYIDTLISVHGLEEWKSAILTNEMHRHLGAYSLVGVKMGILARELLDADLDELNVIAHTGSDPPESCLIDGLQIATGASLGRGTIQSSGEIHNTPKAVFIKNSTRIRIELKTEVIQVIQSEILKNTKKYGYGSHQYFEAIRKMSIQLWVNFNRKFMFEVYDDVSGEKIL
jgi:pyrimidine-specific ribonucleoside hydrolase